jgi:ELWxxDGT repeat protein
MKLFYYCNFIFICVAIFFFSTALHSQIPLLVKDIRSGTTHSDPQELVNVNGTIFFSAIDGINGTEVWKSNGTTAGTILVKDIYPTGSSNPQHLVNVNGILFFIANNNINGYELWKSDGEGYQCRSCQFKPR